MPPSNPNPEAEPIRPWIIATTGGIGSGKSTVAKFFGELGAHLIDADRIAHEILQQAEVIAEIKIALGGEVIGADGTPDHQAISDLVFSDEGARKALERIIHPRVRKRIDVTLAKVADIGFDSGSPLPGGRPLILLDIPLLESSPYRKLVDWVLFIEAPEEDREKRVQQHRGWKPGERELRESAQVPISRKKKTADGVISNPNGTSVEEIQMQCREFLKLWVTHSEQNPE